jgi:hypothetical protein
MRAEEKRDVHNRSEQMVATPKLGIAKGIIIILLGVMWLNNMSYGALLGYQDTGNRGMLLAGVGWALVIFGVCLWRGIVAIRERKVKRVTYLNFGVWTGFFVLTLAYVLYILH